MKSVKFVHKCGNIYQLGNRLYLLSQVDTNRVALIRLGGDGNRYNNPVQVKDIHDITKEEFQLCCGSSSSSYFKYVKTIDQWMKERKNLEDAVEKIKSVFELIKKMEIV